MKVEAENNTQKEVCEHEDKSLRQRGVGLTRAPEWALGNGSQLTPCVL